MDIISFIIGFKKGKESGGGGGFPVKEFFEKTAEELTLGGVTSLSISAITQMSKLKRLSMPNIETISSSAIGTCPMLDTLTFPKSLKSMSSMAVVTCTGLNTVTFEGTPESIGSGAFTGCSNLKTINVPWGYGEVANAPWGATSATINYNHKGD